MQKILLFSHSGFSNENANGITMKNLLSAWGGEEKAEFYCDVQPPDFSAAHQYFRVTDVQAVKALLGRKSQHIFTYSAEMAVQSEKETTVVSQAPKKIPTWLKKHKYNFALRWLREYLRMVSPWGHRLFREWLKEVSPDVIVYMVGESFFMDKMVLTACKETGKPLVLYNGEAYRIIDLGSRSGLERAFYRKVEKTYEQLDKKASLVIYNSEMLKASYQAMYAHPARAIVAYNSASCDQKPYESQDRMNITYFGNLGVGRSDVLVRVAGVLKRIDPSLVLDIYGNATQEQEKTFKTCSNIRYHGFVGAQQLHEIIAQSDILLHVETFDREYQVKLQYAFSTKLAQCLCAGRCFVSFAPQAMASSQYLLSCGGAALVSDEEELCSLLKKLVSDPVLRGEYAEKARCAGQRNHQMQNVARQVREEIGAVIK